MLQRRNGLESLAYFLDFLFTIGRRPRGHIGLFPFKEIGHKDLILVFFVAVSKGVSALNGLWVKAEDVVDGENSGYGVGRTRDVRSMYLSFGS